MNNDFYKNVCQSVDALLKQFIFNLYDDSTHQQIYRKLSDMMIRRADVAHCNVQIFHAKGGVHVVVDFRDYTQRTYSYHKRII